MDYTVEIWKLDKRYKEGRRLQCKIDWRDTAIDVLEKKYQRGKGRIVLIHETWVTRRNLLSGEEFKERYDTPYYCSPSSETYWSR